MTLARVDRPVELFVGFGEFVRIALGEFSFKVRDAGVIKLKVGPNIVNQLPSDGSSGSASSSSGFLVIKENLPASSEEIFDPNREAA